MKRVQNIMKVKDSGLNFSVRMTVTENTIPYMFENICYLHEHGLDNICMIMDVYLKICDELKAEFEKQYGPLTLNGFNSDEWLKDPWPWDIVE